jgi:hypothetical protein
MDPKLRMWEEEDVDIEGLSADDSPTAEEVVDLANTSDCYIPEQVYVQFRWSENDSFGKRLGTGGLQEPII